MKVKYKGYVIKQSKYNNHISVFKDNELVLHLSNCTKQSEDDLKLIVEIFFFDEDEFDDEDY